MRIFYLVFTKSNTFESTDLELEITGNENYTSFGLVYFSDYPVLSEGVLWHIQYLQGSRSACKYGLNPNLSQGMELKASEK